MKTNWLITTAAAAILASTGLATAQGMNERGGGKSSGATMEKSAPAQSQSQQGKGNGGGQMKGQTTGQAPQADSPSRQQQPGAAQQKDMQRDKAGTAGQAPDTQRQQRTGADDQKQPRTGAQKDDQKQPRAGAQKDDQKQPRTGAQKDDQKQPRTGAQQQRQDRQGAETKGRTETTGRGDASGAQLTSEQRTKIRQVVVSKNIPRVSNVNFNVSVGTVVPRTVTFHPIPAEIIEIYPAWRGYRVILVESQLVIVDPGTYRIVAVIAV
jgi:hypothetical protein